MPCWEVRQTSVKLEASDWALLGRALRAEFGEREVAERPGYYQVFVPGGWFKVETGRLVGTESVVQEHGNRVKVAYSREVIRDTAKRFNWRLQDSGVNRFVAQKRGWA